MKKNEQRRDQLNDIFKAYLFDFEQKHDTYIESANEHDFVNGYFIAGDCCFRIEDIIYDIDNDLPKGLIFDWYWKSAENKFKETPNLKNYCKYDKEAQQKYFNNNKNNVK